MASLVAHWRLYRKLKAGGSRVDYPLRNVAAASRVTFGRNVRIRPHAWFSLTPDCRVSIGDNTRIGRYFIVSGVASSITIENDVLMSERVFITESNHEFEDVTKPVQATSVSGGAVVIGAESWIGVGVCIMPGVRIGKHCVIGANSTVTRDVPDYTIVAGTPARIIKQYDFDQQLWVKVKK